MVPITFKRALYYQQARTPTDAELATPLPNGFSNSEPRLFALLLTIYELIDDTEWRVESITQHNFRERYQFASDRGDALVDLNYNGNYDVSIGTVKGSDMRTAELKLLLDTDPIFRDENIARAVSIFSDHIARKNWSVIFVDEKNYKVYLIAQNDSGKIKLELNVPSDSSVSKKGVISSVKVVQADSERVACQFEDDFANGRTAFSADPQTT